MSPATKASFVALLLLGLVVTETNANFVCNDLLSGNVNLNLCLSISIPPSDSPCCHSLADLYANIKASLNAGITQNEICSCLPGLLSGIPVNAAVDLLLNVASGVCLNADLAAFLKLCP